MSYGLNMKTMAMWVGLGALTSFLCACDQTKDSRKTVPEGDPRTYSTPKEGERTPVPPPPPAPVNTNAPARTTGEPDPGTPRP